MLWMLKKMKKHGDAEVFLLPVPRYVPQYYDKIKRPMDLQTMTSKNDRGEYREWREVEADFELMIANCKTFNESGSVIVMMSVRLQEHWRECQARYNKSVGGI